MAGFITRNLRRLCILTLRRWIIRSNHPCRKRGCKSVGTVAFRSGLVAIGSRLAKAIRSPWRVSLWTVFWGVEREERSSCLVGDSEFGVGRCVMIRMDSACGLKDVGALGRIEDPVARVYLADGRAFASGTKELIESFDGSTRQQLRSVFTISLGEAVASLHRLSSFCLHFGMFRRAAEA